jgi:hypothetical protein
VTERTGTIVVVLSQKDASLNGVPEPFFPSIGIDLTPPSDQFWVILYVPQLFLKKNNTDNNHNATRSHNAPSNPVVMHRNQ